MIITNSIYENMFNERAREFVGRVELLEGSALINVFEHDGALQSFTVEKAGDNTKFFGYGICQKATVKLKDKERAINVEKGQGLQIAHGIGSDYLYTYPVFYVDEIVRDENTNELTLTAYDSIYAAANYKVAQLSLPKEFSLKTFAIACASRLGMPAAFINIPENLMAVEYTSQTANFGGNETIRDALDDVAEMFGAIYYLSNDWEITFQRLDKSGEPVAAIDRTKYFELTAKTAHTLENVVSVTDLGDNVSSSSGKPGETQYLRDNAFLTLRDDIGTLLDNILTAVKGMTIYQFECKHRGDFRLEIGDKISFAMNKDSGTFVSYMLDDTITYNGGLVGTTKWEYSVSEAVTENIPSTIGEALKQTYARVDKVDQEITLLAKKIEETDIGEVTTQMTQIQQDLDSITLTVTETQTGLIDLEESVQAQLTSENLSILVGSSIDNVTTKTGFTFDGAGLTIQNTTAPTKTNVNVNGMKITDFANAELLVINNTGVTARNLKANQYFIIGNARFENYNDANGNTRVGCYWI